MFDFLKNRPMLLCAVVSSAVSVVGIYTEKALLYFCPLILLFVFALIYKSVKGEIVLSFVLVLLVAVSTLLSLKEVRAANLLDGRSCTGEFVVVQEPVNHGEYYSTTLEAVDCDLLKKGDKIDATYYKGKMAFSERITATLTLESFEKYKSKFSFYSNGILLNGYISDHKSTGEKDAFLSGIGRIREFIKENIFKYYGKPEAATMLALVTGDRSYFTNKFYGNVKAAGVAHVMVVSGMHLSVIVSFALIFIEKHLYNRFLKAFVILFVTFAVVVVCGFTMSVMRAGVTYIFIALSLILQRESTPENTLGAAVSMILIFNPLAIMNVAFELSVLSTFAILVVALPINKYVIENRIIKEKWLQSALLIVLISLSALIFTSPVTIYVFGYVSNVSLVTNLLICAATSVAMKWCLLGFVLPPLGPVLFFVSGLIVKYVNLVINLFGNLPWATTDTPEWLAFVMAGLILVILWILIACKDRQNMIKLREIRFKKYNERGRLKWHLFTNRH